MKSILAVVCLIGLVVCQPQTSPEPEPTTGKTAAAVVADVVAKPPAETTPQAPETKPAPKPEEKILQQKKGCQPLCKTPLETCVRLANCQGNDCFKCAITASIVLPGTTKPQAAIPVTLPANLPNAFQSIMNGQANALQQVNALQQAAAAQGAVQTAQQPSQGMGGLFGSTGFTRDPFNNMLFGTMLMDGGMGFGF